jgi:hypothetical protein
MVDNSIRVFSNEEVDKARDGRKIYGFKRYLDRMFNVFLTTNRSGTHKEAMRISRGLVLKFWRDLHVWTRDQAPTASFRVHSTEASFLELGNIVVKNDRSIGDYRHAVSQMSCKQPIGRLTWRNEPPEYGSMSCLKR